MNGVGVGVGGSGQHVAWDRRARRKSSVYIQRSSGGQIIVVAALALVCGPLPLAPPQARIIKGKAPWTITLVSRWNQASSIHTHVTRRVTLLVLLTSFRRV